MSFWSHNPELLDRITTEALPSPYKERIENGDMELSDVPDKIACKAMDEGIADYWAGQADRMKGKL